MFLEDSGPAVNHGYYCIGDTQMGWSTELSWRQETARISVGCRHFHSFISFVSLHGCPLRQPQVACVCLAGFRAEMPCRDVPRSGWRPGVTNADSTCSIKPSSLPRFPTSLCIFISIPVSEIFWNFAPTETTSFFLKGNRLREMEWQRFINSFHSESFYCPSCSLATRTLFFLLPTFFPGSLLTMPLGKAEKGTSQNSTLSGLAN